MNTTIAFALSLSALAGLSTTLGSLLGVFVRKPGPRFMTLSLGFSGGVMILVSFVELLQHGITASALFRPIWPSSAAWGPCSWLTP